MPMPNFSVGLGSFLRTPSHVHSAAKTGANSRMKAELKDWVWAAFVVRKPLFGSCVLRSAKRFKDEPACSNSVQNTVAAATRINASPSLWDSCELSFVMFQAI